MLVIHRQVYAMVLLSKHYEADMCRRYGFHSSVENALPVVVSFIRINYVNLCVSTPLLFVFVH